MRRFFLSLSLALTLSIGLAPLPAIADPNRISGVFPSQNPTFTGAETQFSVLIGDTVAPGCYLWLKHSNAPVNMIYLALPNGGVHRKVVLTHKFTKPGSHWLSAGGETKAPPGGFPVKGSSGCTGSAEGKFEVKECKPPQRLARRAEGGQWQCLAARPQEPVVKGLQPRPGPPVPQPR